MRYPSPTVTGGGRPLTPYLRYCICKSFAPRSRQITTSVPQPTNESISQTFNAVDYRLQSSYTLVDKWRNTFFIPYVSCFLIMMWGKLWEMFVKPWFQIKIKLF